MENQISPKAEMAEVPHAAEVAELELQAVIGFNGEAMSMSGLGGVGTLGCVVLTGAVRQRVVPGRQVGCWHEPLPGPYMGAGGWGGDSFSCTKALESQFFAPSLNELDGYSQHLKGPNVSSEGCKDE